MKKVILLFLSLFSIALLSAQTTKTVGASGADYSTLKAACDAINSGSITGAITLQIIDNTTETLSIILNTSGSPSSYSSITIYPTITGKSINGNVNGPLIDLNGADNVIIDGRLNASGSTKDLIITNTSTGTSASTIRFYGSAENNSIKYCTLKGSETSTTKGIILFDGATAGNGNDNNTIDHNNITSDAAGRPINAIFSQGSNGFENNGITISNNNIYDVLNKSNASYMIRFEVYTTASTISGNSLYETSSFASTADVDYNAIRINNTYSGINISVTGNYIGGSSALCGGSAWTKSNEKNNKFYAIFINSSNGTAGNENSVQNNTISNFSWSNSGAADWAGIYISSGSVNVGNTTGNIIGSASKTITVSGGATNTTVYGIYNSSTGTFICQNNTIGSITVSNSDGALASNFYGINRTSSATTTISNNTIGGSSNTIQTSSTSTNNAQSLIGIYNTGGGTLTINNNIIANLTNSTTNTNVATTGLVNGITSGYGTITNNSIHDLTIANSNTATDQTASVCGIVLTNTGTGKTLTGNTVYNLSNSNPSFEGSVIGIFVSNNTSTNSISRNFIHSLSVNVASTSASLFGIKVSTVGSATYSNNIINLGGNSATTIYGIYDGGTSSQAYNFYYNTVYIGGNLSAGIANKSYCLFSAATTTTRIYKNNILQNSRSTIGGVSLHYAAYFNYAVSTSLTLDYNNYYTTGTGGVLGFFNSVDVVSLPLIATFDANSLSINPSFATPGGTVSTNYIPATVTLAGTTISTISTDYALTNRAGTPTMGAYDITLNLSVDVYKAGAFQSSYTTLKGAFDKINNGLHTGALEIRIKANTTETVSAVLYRSGYTGAGGTSNYTSVNIFPTVSGITIAGNLDAYMIDLDGADNVTIDGRVNASGSTKDLIISNTSTGSNSASTIRFYGSAENNTVKYCTLKGSGTSSVKGIIYFAQSISGNGNDGNIIDHNDITSSGAGRPINAIFSAGASGFENNNNTISNNNIYDFLRSNSSSNGINIFSWSTDWIISGNSFYETTTFIPTGAFAYYVISLSTLSKNLVSDNYIGGSQPLCAGSAFNVNSSRPHYLRCFFVNGGNTLGTSCTIQNNIIRNINYTSTESNPWDGIYIKSGNVNITGNTIGATTGNGSIQVSAPTASAFCTLSGGSVTAITMNGGGSGYTTIPVITFTAPPSGGTAPTASATLSGGAVSVNLISGGSGYTSAPIVYFDGMGTYSTSHGINNYSSGIVNITNNNIGSITTIGSSSYSHGIESIYFSSAAGTNTISNNLVGSLSTTNSIYASSSAASSLQKQDVYGIYSSGAGTNIISNNTIANLTNGYTGTNQASRARGIHTSAGSNTIQNNTVRNIFTASAQTGGGSNVSLIGISQVSNVSGTTQTLTGNSIYNLSNTNGTAKGLVFGMYYAGPTSGTNSVSSNFVHSLSVSSSDVGASIYGIAMNSGVVTCANNIINLGGSSLGYIINGIWDGTIVGNTINIYYNSVYIGGSVTSGVTSPTAALNNATNTSTRNYRNNILYNARTGGSTGKHYAIIIAGVATTTIDYNDYFVSGTVLGKIGTLEKSNIAAWKTGTSQDVNSLSINPVFTTPGGTTAFDYYTSATIPGITISEVSTDFDGLTRGTTPKMGSLEYNNFTWTGATSNDFATGANWTSGSVPPNGANISFAASPSNHCVLDQNRSFKGITNTQATKNLVLNGKQLTITGNLNFTNNAKIDGTTEFSSVVFAGSTAQNIPSGSFVSNTIDSLAINNVNGLTLNGDFTINKGIALIAGNFTIGPNTLTINGNFTTMTGTVTGGSSTNMIIGGTGEIINMPTFLLHNLTINRASGVSLYGDVNIVGGLTLTNGLLTVGANTLTISGNSLSNTNGSIDASNTSATIYFNNSTAITLPSTIFTSAINNLTINSTGGITASSNLIINGILNLQSANPSATKGKLDMGTNTLSMGANATTIGIGDVTGIVKRTSFVASTDYTFGNQFTTMTFSAGGTMPTDISFKISIGVAPSWKASAVKRDYDIIRTGGASTTVTLSLHYLDSELQSNTEDNLVQWDYHTSPSLIVEEHGKANQNISDNWVAISNRNITYFGTTFGTHKWGFSNKESPNFTWQGTPSNEWNDPNNWSGGIVPSTTSDVIIPNATTTIHNPLLPDSAVLKTIIINVGGILDGGTSTLLTVTGSTGAWLNMGSFNAGTSTVIFTHANATMADPTNFYNLTIATGAGLTPENGNVMRIAGTLTNNGTLRAALLPNTIEFNGTNQTIINPNGLTQGYYNLILSGNGFKTLPATNLSIAGDFTLSDSVSTSAASSLTVNGNFAIGVGTSFETGVYNHLISGNFDNNGTFTATSGGTITMNGASAQTIFGTVPSTFDNLTINNTLGVSLLENTTVSNVLTLTNGNLTVGSTLLEINGTISKTSGFIEVSSSSSLGFGGTSAITLLSDIFSSTPSINNLTINRSGGVTLGNQNMTINGTLNLSSGILNIATNTITITGNSPTRTTGSLDVSDAGSTLFFYNNNPITLPSSFFNGNVNNLTLNTTGGITASSDFTINGILNLQSTNPISTKGSLDMWDGSAAKTLTMGANATTIGLGDVTGIIKRTTINPGVTYTFGNQFMSVYFPNEGTLPSEMSAKISIGTEPSWRSGAIQREIEIIQTGGNATKAAFSCHYLDSELNGNNEGHLVLWTKYLNLEYGRSAYNMVDDWVNLSNVNVAFFPSSWTGTKNLTLDEYSDVTTLTWNGSLSDSWTSVENWTPNAGPSSDKNIIIPDASTTPRSPILPAVTEIKTLTIESAGILNSTASAQLTVNGGNSAWNNTGGIFNFGTSNVVFTNAAATISGSTNFYNITIDANKVLSMENGGVMKISGTLTNNGSLRAVNVSPTTVEYNGGDQTVLNPNGSTTGYYNLTLSGSGTKTLPISALTILGDLSIDGTTTVNANSALSISGNLSIANNATFNTGNFNHQIDGNITNYGIFNPSANYVVTLNGSSAQTIGGTSLSTFGDLTISNINGVTLNNDVSITKTLQLTSGVIHTGSNNVILTNTANSIVGASSSNYIDGNCRKIGNTAFVFPVGNNGKYAPIGISAANGGGNINDFFTASYYNSMPHERGLDSTQHDTSIIRISGSEYWQLDRNGTNNVGVTLSWDARSGGVSSLSDLTVAHWNGSKWEDMFNSATSGDTIAGTITSGLITSFSPFTLASKKKGVNSLPVSLINFNVKCQNNQSLLSWTTASETNNNYFEIQKSTDAKSWNFVSKVMGAGNSTQQVNYEYLDYNLEKSDFFYRIKQVDFDGAFDFSSIVYLKKCSLSYFDITVFPNPVKSIVNIQFNGDKNQVHSIEIFNLLGEKVFFSDRFLSTIDLSDKQNGTYFIHLNFVTENFVEKFVLQK
ncbi:MAG: T9SS type A sorting domain-containing protein [Bacteroidota bacterium]